MHNHLVDIMEAYKVGGKMSDNWIQNLHITPPPVHVFFPSNFIKSKSNLVCLKTTQNV